MRNDETPAWATELRDFVEFTIGKLEERTSIRFDGLESRMSGFESRLTGFESRLTGFENRIVRKIDAMDARLESIEKDVSNLKLKRKK